MMKGAKMVSNCWLKFFLGDLNRSVEPFIESRKELRGDLPYEEGAEGSRLERNELEDVLILLIFYGRLKKGKRVIKAQRELG